MAWMAKRPINFWIIPVIANLLCILNNEHWFETEYLIQLNIQNKSLTIVPTFLIEWRSSGWMAGQNCAISFFGLIFSNYVQTIIFSSDRYFKINVQKCVKVWGQIRPAFRPLHKVNEIRVMQEKCNNNRAGGNGGLMGTIPSIFFLQKYKK